MPPAPTAETLAEVSETDIVITFAQRRWRVRGLARNTSVEVLKINLMVSCGERLFVDNLDLYSAKARHNYTLQAAAELLTTEEIVKTDLAHVFRKLEELQQAALQKALQPKVPEAVKMAEAEREAALELLRDPKLIARIASDFGACGIVGESTNKLTGYLAAVSRKLERPLAVVLQSSSAAGKSSLMDAVLAFMPEEERVKYSAMTGQSLFYMGETNLKHKILAIVEEEGASKASYALKLLQSEGELTIASTGKDPDSGNLITQQYRVEGPVMIFLTTTAIEIDEELLNRCLVLSVDEGRAQTEAIHRLQRARRTLQGLIDKQEKQRLIQLHQNAQRLLKPLHVVNPYADHLTFLSDRTRTRRDHEKYLTLIDAIALLHQYQRPLKTSPCGNGAPLDYIEVTLDDIGQANVIAHEVLGRSLDELPPQTRRLLGEVVKFVDTRASAQAMRKGDVRFSRREVREHAGWSDFQVKTHMHKLEELEYVLTHRGGRGQSFEYELLYDGDGSRAPHLFGLIDPSLLPAGAGIDALKHGYDADKEHQKSGKEPGKSKLEGSSSPQVVPKEHPSRSHETPCEPIATGVPKNSSSPPLKTHVSQGNGKNPSYTQVVAHPTNAAAAAAGQ